MVALYTVPEIVEFCNWKGNTTTPISRKLLVRNGTNETLTVRFIPPGGKHFVLVGAPSEVTIYAGDTHMMKVLCSLDPNLAHSPHSCCREVLFYPPRHSREDVIHDCALAISTEGTAPLRPCSSHCQFCALPPAPAAAVLTNTPQKCRRCRHGANVGHGGG